MTTDVGLNLLIVYTASLAMGLFLFIFAMEYDKRQKNKK